MSGIQKIKAVIPPKPVISNEQEKKFMEKCKELLKK